MNMMNKQSLRLSEKMNMRKDIRRELLKEKYNLFWNYWKISVQYQIKFVKESTMKKISKS